jgi:hypothetical protein
LHFPHHNNCIAALSPPNNIKCLVIKLTNAEPVGCKLNSLDLEKYGNGRVIWIGYKVAYPSCQLHLEILRKEKKTHSECTRAGW